jgi:hypothetical protein
MNNRYYVYALIDPETKIPFYVGKGSTNRIAEHFRNLQDTRVGLAPNELIEKFMGSEGADESKLSVITALKSKGYEAKDIARVIARRLSKSAAFDIESCLITSIYGRSCLTNIQAGHHAERFRGHARDDYLPDFSCDQFKADLSLNIVTQSGKSYVYALINPDTQKIFYIGKGKGNRVFQHFLDARSGAFDLNDTEKLAKIRELLALDHKESNIAHILAIADSEENAYLLETLYIKFVVGYSNLSNIQPGKCSDLFRARDDWSLRYGFDIPLIIEKGQKRVELLDEFLGNGIDFLLYQVRGLLREDTSSASLEFSNAVVRGAGELCIDAVVDKKITLRIQARHNRTFQVALVATNNVHKKWLVTHFRKLEAFPYNRADFRFTPIPWVGIKSVTTSVDIAFQRTLKLIKLIRANSRADLTPELSKELLSGLPYLRATKPEEDIY